MPREKRERWITNSKRGARSSRNFENGGKGKHTYLSAGESRLAYRVARLSVAASASEPTITASSIAAAVVVPISSPGPSAPSSQFSVDSSPDAAAAGVARPLCVIVTLSIALTFVVFFSLHKRKGMLRTPWYAQLKPIKKKLMETNCRMTHLLRCCCHGYAQNVLSCRS
jgi:hypothetical protein